MLYGLFMIVLLFTLYYYYNYSATYIFAQNEYGMQ